MNTTIGKELGIFDAFFPGVGWPSPYAGRVDPFKVELTDGGDSISVVAPFDYSKPVPIRYFNHPNGGRYPVAEDVATVYHQAYFDRWNVRFEDSGNPHIQVGYFNELFFEMNEEGLKSYGRSVGIPNPLPTRCEELDVAWSQGKGIAGGFYDIYVIAYTTGGRDYNPIHTYETDKPHGLYARQHYFKSQDGFHGGYTGYFFNDYDGPIDPPPIDPPPPPPPPPPIDPGHDVVENVNELVIQNTKYIQDGLSVFTSLTGPLTPWGKGRKQRITAAIKSSAMIEQYLKSLKGVIKK